MHRFIWPISAIFDFSKLRHEMGRHICLISNLGLLHENFGTIISACPLRRSSGCLVCSLYFPHLHACTFAAENGLSVPCFPCMISLLFKLGTARSSLENLEVFLQIKVVSFGIEHLAYAPHWPKTSSNVLTFFCHLSY